MQMLRDRYYFRALCGTVWLMLGAVGVVCIALPFGLRWLLGSIDAVYMKRFVPMLVLLYIAVLAALAMCALLLALLWATERGTLGRRGVAAILIKLAWCGAVQCAALTATAVVMLSGAGVIFLAAAGMAALAALTLWAVAMWLRQRR